MKKLLIALKLMNFARKHLSMPVLLGLFIIASALFLLNPLLTLGVFGVILIYVGAKLRSFLS